MKVRELIKKVKHDDVFVLEDTFAQNSHGWHHDYLTCIDEDEAQDREVIDFDVMTPKEATTKVFANSSVDLMVVYEKTDKLLFVKVEKA